MPAQDEPITNPDTAPPPETLQFRRAEPIGDSSAQRCIACKAPITATYFQASGRVVCPNCAAGIQQWQQQTPAFSFPRALLYGAAAALAGCAIYAIVAIATGMEIGLIAILVGIMVGKAIRRASGGFGGRPQQILAVLLTYFSISSSYIPVILWEVTHKTRVEAPRTVNGETPSVQATETGIRNPGKLILSLLVIGAVAPFLSLTSGVSSIISLFIIFIGLRQAWKLTGRSDVMLMGPYQTAGGSA
jgi:hypothetical protein